MTKVQPIPEGFHTITPYFLIKDAPAFMDFMHKAFNAIEVFTFKDNEGTIRHAQMKVGDSIFMLSEAQANYPIKNAMIYLYVNDVDSAYQQAVNAGGKSILPPKDQFYGDRSGCVEDGFGNQWWIASRTEELSEEEFKTRTQNMQYCK